MVFERQLFGSGLYQLFIRFVIWYNDVCIITSPRLLFKSLKKNYAMLSFKFLNGDWRFRAFLDIIFSQTFLGVLVTHSLLFYFSVMGRRGGTQRKSLVPLNRQEVSSRSRNSTSASSSISNIPNITNDSEILAPLKTQDKDTYVKV